MENQLYKKLNDNPSLTGISLDLVETDSMTLTDGFICLICLNLVINPVFCEEGDCIYCKNCIELWNKRDANCPNCRKEFKKNTRVSRILKNMLNKIKLKCHNEGCKEVTEHENYEHHLNNCDFAQYICKVSGCNFQSHKKAIIEHLLNCDYLEVNCEFCSLITLKNSIKDHYLICPKFKKFCPVCKNLVENVEMSTHQKGSCMETLKMLFLNNSKIKDTENKVFLTDYDETKINNSVLLQKVKILEEEISRIDQESKNKDLKIKELLNDIEKIKSQSFIQTNINNLQVGISNNNNLVNVLPICTNHNFELIHISVISKCHLCKIEGFCRFKCKKCNISVCYKCNRPKDLFKCPKGHSLKRTIRKLPFNCDICYQYFNENSSSLSDVECDLDICKNCEDKKDCTIF